MPCRSVRQLFGTIDGLCVGERAALLADTLTQLTGRSVRAAVSGWTWFE